MQILTILGSPRKKGNTATILSAFERIASVTEQVERINLVDYELHGCLGDDACQKKLSVPGCVQRDDIAAILERMQAADVLVYASPLYCWDFTAQMKMLIDRHYCLTKWRDGGVAKSFLAGRRALLLVTCGGEIENNADLIQVVFARQMECAGCRIVGQQIVPNCSTPKELGARAEDTARAMWEQIRVSAAV